MKYAPQSALTALLTATAAVPLLFAMAAPAQAHDELVSTNPSAEQVLAEAPEQITMTFSGNITEVDGANQVRVTDSEGSDVTSGETEVNGTRVSQKINGRGSESETYTVTWRVVSSDGHPIQGTYNLTVGEGKTAPAAAESSAGATEAETSRAEGGETTNIVVFTTAAAAVIALLVTVILKARSRRD